MLSAASFNWGISFREGARGRRAASATTAATGLRLQSRRIAEHDLQRLTEQRGDPRISRPDDWRPGHRLGHHLVVATINGVDVEDARPPLFDARDTVANGAGAEIGRGIEPRKSLPLAQLRAPRSGRPNLN